MAKVKVYTTDNCSYCTAAKRLLENRQIEFEEIKFDRSNSEMWIRLYEKSGMRTVPQIFHGEELIGGYTELAERDKLDSLAFLK